ncbi:MAG: PD40 domain-containing protein [Desulfurellaceae bacterium]|nr:PD40 domain-containing protein [Desulfurellaceae bacterium]
MPNHSTPEKPNLRNRKTQSDKRWLCLAVLALGWATPALAQPTCTITELMLPRPTGRLSNVVYDVSADGRRMLFKSNINLTGQNADEGLEFFLYDVPTGTITQVTDTFGSGLMNGAMSADGSRIVFSARLNLTGQNADGSTEIFLYDVPTGTLTQVTDQLGNSSYFSDSSQARRTISADGSRLAFSSWSNLTGQNADGSTEIFLYDVPTDTLTQITNGSHINTDFNYPQISADGTRLAFSVGNTHFEDEGFWSSGTILVYDVPTGAFIEAFGDVSARNDVDFRVFSADGTRVAFTSGGNGNVPRNNDPWELFVYDVPTRALTQVTKDSIFAPPIKIIRPVGTRLTNVPRRDSPRLPIAFLSFSADGNRMAFAANGPGAAGAEEIFLFDLQTSTLTQITNTQTGGGTILEGHYFSHGIDFSADGTRIAFESRNGSTKLFLYDVPTDTLLHVTGSPPVDDKAVLLDQFSANGTHLFFHAGQFRSYFDPYLATCPKASSGVLADAVLENPQPDSFQSGLGIISGWACDATKIEIAFDGGPPIEAAYGTDRGDTQSACGDTDNGFGLLVNWNLLGDGSHTVRALADGSEFANVTVRVTTFGENFLQDASGEYTVSDFPQVGQDVVVRWQESQQNFVITDGSAGPSGGTSGRSPRVLENPAPGSFQSGIGIISGWVCEADRIEVQFNSLPPVEAAYGTDRGDTQGACGDRDNGFGLLFNWNLLGDGTHTVRALADGTEFASVTVTVRTFGEPFLQGASREFTLADFPEVGTDVVLRWQEAQQNFVITQVSGSGALVR